MIGIMQNRVEGSHRQAAMCDAPEEAQTRFFCHQSTIHLDPYHLCNFATRFLPRLCVGISKQWA